MSGLQMFVLPFSTVALNCHGKITLTTAVQSGQTANDSSC